MNMHPHMVEVEPPVGFLVGLKTSLLGSSALSSPARLPVPTRRSAVLSKPQAPTSSAASAATRTSIPIYSEALESCIRTVQGANSDKKADVFKMMARDALKYARAAGIDVVGVLDRFQQLAEAIGLVIEHGQDTVQQWLADASGPERDAAPVSGGEQLGASPAPRADNKRTLITHRASDVEPERIEWLWPGRIAVGKLTLIAGKPGLGKSQVTIDIAGTVSNGGCWPCDEGRAPLGNVVIFSAEDGIADTIVPRLIGIGADRSRIEIPLGVTDANGRRTFDLKADIDLLEAKVRSIGNVRLIVIDPISSYLGRSDSHNNSEMRAVLEPIAEMANRLGIAVVAVTHLNKGSGGAQSVMERFTGSIAFIAAARAGFFIIEDDENEGRLLFLSVKNNLAPKQKGLAFRLEQHLIEGNIVVSGVAWHGQHIERTADEALAATEARGGDDRSSKDDAADFLRSLLAHGPLPVKEIEAQAVEASLLAEGKPIGQSKAFRLARDILGIKTRRDGFGAGAHYVWELPCMPSESMDAHQNNGASMGEKGIHGDERQQ